MGSALWTVVVGALVGAQICVSLLLIDDLLTAYRFAQRHPATSSSVLHEDELPFPCVVLCNTRMPNVELEPFSCQSTSASGAVRHCLAGGAAADPSAASAEPFWASNVSCIGLPSALGPVDAYGSLSVTLRVHSAVERALAAGAFPGSAEQPSAEQLAAEQPGVDLWLMPPAEYERMRGTGECARPVGLQGVRQRYTTQVLASKRIDSVLAPREALWRPGQLREDVRAANRWLASRASGPGRGGPDAGARAGEGAPPALPPLDGASLPDGGAAAPAASAEADSAGLDPAEAGAESVGVAAAAAAGDAAGVAPLLVLSSAGASAANASGAQRSARRLDAYAAPARQHAQAEPAAQQPTGESAPPAPGREVYAVASSASPMYGPFQSQPLGLLEVQLRWLSTDVAVQSQVVVFSKAQLVGLICAVLACAHLARALVQAWLAHALRRLGAACRRGGDAPPSPQSDYKRRAALL